MHNIRIRNTVVTSKLKTYILCRGLYYTKYYDGGGGVVERLLEEKAVFWIVIFENTIRIQRFQKSQSGSARLVKLSKPAYYRILLKVARNAT